MSEAHIEWFKRVTGGESNRSVSERAGISNVTLGRQLKAGELSADLIIKIADSYDESPVIALIDLGFMSAKWMTKIGTTTALTRVSDEELTDELLRRLRLLDDAPVDELAERRNSNTHPEDVPPLRYVADDTDTEPGMGDEGYHDGP